MSAQAATAEGANRDIAPAEERNENSILPTETRNDTDDVFEKFPRMEQVDQFGAHAKTDPREIALVKKLDWFVIVRIPIVFACRATC